MRNYDIVIIPFGFGVMLSKVVIEVWKFSDSNPIGGLLSSSEIKVGWKFSDSSELPSSEIKVGEILISEVLSAMIPQANLLPAFPYVVAGSKVSSLA